MTESESKNRAMIIFVLGLVGLVSCQALGPVAYVMGGNYVRDCAMEGIEPDSLGNAGRILGLIGTVLLALGVVFMLLYFVLVVAVIGAGV